MTEDIVFSRHVDGRVTVNGWPKRTSVAADLLDQAATQPNPYLRKNGNDLVIDVWNGRAVYRLRRTDDPRTYEAVRRSAVLDAA